MIQKLFEALCNRDLAEAGIGKAIFRQIAIIERNIQFPFCHAAITERRPFQANTITQFHFANRRAFKALALKHRDRCREDKIKIDQRKQLSERMCANFSNAIPNFKRNNLICILLICIIAPNTAIIAVTHRTGSEHDKRIRLLRGRFRVGQYICIVPASDLLVLIPCISAYGCLGCCTFCIAILVNRTLFGCKERINTVFCLIRTNIPEQVIVLLSGLLLCSFD